MELWIPAAFVLVIATAYALFYVLNSIETEGANAFGMVNVIGLVTVILGILAAGAVLRRSARP